MLLNCSMERPRGNFFQCTSAQKDTEEAKVSNETTAVHLMKALAATTRGLTAFLVHYCQSSSGGTPCKALYKRDIVTAKRIYKFILDVEMSGELEKLHEGIQSRPFNKEGNGNIGYTILQIDKTNTGFEYEVIKPAEAEAFSKEPRFSKVVERDGKRNVVSNDLLESVSEECEVKEQPLDPKGPDGGMIALGVAVGLLFLVVVCLVILYWHRSSKY